MMRLIRALYVGIAAILILVIFDMVRSMNECSNQTDALGHMATLGGKIPDAKVNKMITACEKAGAKGKTYERLLGIDR